jgi:hypothetical protein
MPLFTLHFHNCETPVSSAEPTSKILDNTQFRCNFHLQEWTSLRAEITSQIDHTRKLELATVAGLGAFYGWFFVTKAVHSNLTNFLLVIPCLLVLLAGLRAWGTLVRIQEIATYIRSIETEFALNQNGLIGWDRTRDELFSKSSPFKVSAAIFWVACLGVSFLAWFYL